MKPLGNKIQLDIKKTKIGVIQSDSIEEHGTIVALGSKVSSEELTVGSTLYFKSWAVDVITEGTETLYFISADSDAICAIKA